MVKNTSAEINGDTSAVWEKHVPVPDKPEGFTVRTTYPSNPDGVEVMLERWLADSEEQRHGPQDLQLGVRAGLRRHRLRPRRLPAAPAQRSLQRQRQAVDPVPLQPRALLPGP